MGNGETGNTRMRVYRIIRQISRFLFRIFCFVLLASCFLLPASFSSVQENYPIIGKIENILFSKSFPNLKISDRISLIEKNVFGKTYPKDSLDVRTKRLKANVLGVSNDLQNENSDTVEAPLNTNQKFQDDNDYENLQTQEVNSERFQDILYEFINEERSFKGLLPLVKDEIASNVAFEQTKETLTKGYLSYSNLKNQYPDERYTLAGGTGSTMEIIKGFEKNPTEKEIRLTELLAKQLVQAIQSNHDDAQILYSPYVNHCGIGFTLSDNKKRFVSIIEFVTKGGSFEPIKPQINLNEQLIVTGKINSPYKFKAISISYYDSSRLNFENENNNPEYFGNENLKPYFPPQDYIAYSNTARSTFIKVIKGIGIIGAIGAAPFTGGASAILAPPLISSIQDSPPREIPLKGGIKINRNGEFSGEVELNYQGKSGLYYISVLAELPGVNFPIVISRRTVRVSGLLPTVNNHFISKSKNAS